MKRLFLIYGDPRSGKSSLAEMLENNYSFKVLPLDELYVEFIKTNCPEFYFERLRNYIRQHYHFILDNDGYTKTKFGRDFVKEWHEYLLMRASQEIARHDTLVLEGYLLIDCLGDLEAQLSMSAQVFLVHVSNGKYRVLSTPLRAKEIAVLGQTKNK